MGALSRGDGCEGLGTPRHRAFTGWNARGQRNTQKKECVGDLVGPLEYSPVCQSLYVCEQRS